MSLLRRVPLVVGLLLALQLATIASAHAAPQQFYVRTDGSDTTCNGSANSPASSAPNCAFKTINKAVTVAPVDSKIKIGPGTFPEQLTLVKDLTIEGAGQTNTKITVPTTPVPNVPSPNDPSPPTLATGYALVAVVASEVGLSNVTLAGPWPFPGNCAAQFYGAFVYATGTLNISRSAVIDIRNTDPKAFGCQQGIGIQAGRPSVNTTGNLIAYDIDVTAYQKGGIVVSGQGSTGSIKNSTVTGAGAGTQLAQRIAQNGIQVSFGATATVVNNTVAKNACDDTPAGCGSDPFDDTQSVGILVYDAESGTYLIGNKASQNDIGFYSHSRGITVADGNIMSDNRFVQVFLDQGTSILLNNQLLRGQYGLVLAAFDGNTDNTDGWVSGGRIAGSPFLIVLADLSPTQTANLEITQSTRCGDAAACDAYRSPQYPRRHDRGHGHARPDW